MILDKQQDEHRGKYAEHLHCNLASVEGELIYCIGDIHGCYELLKLLLSKIFADCASRAREQQPILIFCGNYVDRGPDSAKVLEAVCWLKRYATFETHFLMGGHERAMLDYLDHPHEASAWLELGGSNTLSSYGVAWPGATAGALEHMRARDDLLHRMPASHLTMLNNLELIIGIGDYAFVHAGVEPKRPMGKQNIDDLLGIQERFIDWPGSFEKIIVHGHASENDEVQVLKHRIGIDSAAYKTGILSAVRIEDEAVKVIQVGG